MLHSMGISGPRRIRLVLAVCAGVWAIAPSSTAGVREDLELLRDRCLTFATGHAPLDSGTQTIRHGLWAQSPWSGTDEIDMPASGFAMAGLPCAVTNGLTSWATAYVIATNASRAVRLLVESSAGASNAVEVARYGYGGILFHNYTWNDAASQFHGKANSEISSVDTVLLMFGLLVSAQFFGGQVLDDYEAARDAIDWRSWLDATTVGHENQIRMAYYPGSGFSKWWDWYSQETMLVCLFAAMSDPSIDVLTVWDAWRRDRVVYVSPGPNSQRFECYATWNGDPFTVYYGLLFFPFAAFPPSGDPAGVNWFREGQTAYLGHVEFFKKERGYRAGMTYSFFTLTGGGAIAEPKSSPDVPASQFVAPIHAIAGGLPYCSATVESNQLAQTLSMLVGKGTNFFRWHGWPPATVVATNSAHAVHSDWVVGQDICATAISIENYLNGTVQRLALKDKRLRSILMQLWRPVAVGMSVSGNTGTIQWRGIPQAEYAIAFAPDLTGSWISPIVSFPADAVGEVTTPVSTSEAQQFFQLVPFVH